MKFTMRAEKIRLMAEKRKATILEEITSIWLALLSLSCCTNCTVRLPYEKQFTQMKSAEFQALTCFHSNSFH